MSAAKIGISVAAAGALAVGFSVYQSSRARAAAEQLAGMRAEFQALAVRLPEIELHARTAEQELTERNAAVAQPRTVVAPERQSGPDAEAEKAQQERALQRFLASHPELQKLRAEFVQASLRANSFGRFKSQGRTPAEIELLAADHAERRQFEAEQQAAGVEPSHKTRGTTFDASQIAKRLCTNLYFANEPLTPRQLQGLEAILAGAINSDDARVNRFARIDWDRVLSEAQAILSPAQQEGLRGIAAWGRKETVLAAAAKLSSTPRAK